MKSNIADGYRRLVIGACIALLSAIGVKATTERQPLRTSETVTRDIQPGETHEYVLSLNLGEYAGIVVDQNGADVGLRAVGPDDAVAGAIDTPSGYDKPERMSVIANVGGIHRVEVRSMRSNPAPGKYAIRVELIRRASDTDRKRAAAERAFMAGEELRAAAGAENLRNAAARFEEARALWAALGDDTMTGDAAQHAGFVHDLLNDYPKATQHYESALALRRAIGDARREAETLSNIGAVYRATGNLEKALEVLHQALALRRQTGDRRGEASTLHNLGSAYWSRADYEQAALHYSQELTLRRATADRNGEAEALTGLGVTARVVGQTARAIEYYEEALAIKRETNDRRGAAITLHNLGVAYSTLGAFTKAIEHYKESIDLSRAEGNRSFESSALTSTGIAWKFLGEYRKALDAFREALAVKRSIGDKRGEAEALSYSGLAHEAIGEPKSALALYLEALPLNRETGDRRGEAFTLANLGAVSVTLGEVAKAIEYLDQALQLQQSIRDENSEAGTLLTMATIDRDRGDLASARRRIEAALAIFERARARVPVQNLRATYVALKQDHYKFYVDLLMRMHERNPSAGHDAEAFIAAEQGRARGLRELLAEARAGLNKGIDPEIVRRREKIEQQLNTKERERMRLLAGKATPEQRSAAERAVESLLAEYHQIEAEIRAGNPQYALLTDRKPLVLESVQRLLDADTVLLEYSLGRERSFVWAVTRDSIRAAYLPAAGAIEKVARRFHELVSASPKREREPALRAVARQLSDLVLKPSSASLRRARRLVIVGEGALQFVPFSALPSPVGDRSPLVAQHEIVMLPSAAVLPVLRGNKRREQAPQSVAVLADPVLRADDPRVTGIDGGRPVATDDAVVRSAREAGFDFERLPSTRLEAESILSLVDPATTLKAMDFDASRETAMSASLRNYRYIHFATHGLVNGKRPELSGIVLSLVDRDGAARDGFLRLHDIYNLDLNADLVVLSACRTALGAEMRGEGLIGLSRGFMYAGSPRVLASLWDVRDKATAEFMKQFYQQMLKQKRSPAAALRATQISFLKEGVPAAYWAPFVLQGDWE